MHNPAERGGKLLKSQGARREAHRASNLQVGCSTHPGRAKEDGGIAVPSREGGSHAERGSTPVSMKTRSK